eukprot:COSAG01_NODE_13578_length_1565_cov_3.347203_1_plen_346_part_00
MRWAGDVGPLLEHIHTILCNGNQDHSQYLLNCMAHMVQYPWRRLNVCICMISEEGAGKSIVWSRFMGAILGNNYLSHGNHSAVLGQFNDCLSGKVLINCEELVWGGHGVGILKDLLTSDSLFINRKNCQPWTERNFVNLVICTNGHHAVPASLSARRFFVLQPSNLYSGAQSTAAKAWFKKVLDVDPKAFAHFLYNRNLDGFCPRNVPVTEALTAQKHRSMDAVECVVHEWLTRGYIMDSCTPWRADAEQTLPRSAWFKRADRVQSHARFSQQPADVLEQPEAHADHAGRHLPAARRQRRPPGRAQAPGAAPRHVADRRRRQLQRPLVHAAVARGRARVLGQREV